LAQDEGREEVAERRGGREGVVDAEHAHMRRVGIGTDRWRIRGRVVDEKDWCLFTQGDVHYRYAIYCVFIALWLGCYC